MKGLEGKQIGIAADRSAGEISTLIEKKGGNPVIYSIQGRQSLNEQTSRRNIEDFLGGDFDWAIFTTGIGANTLTESAEKIGFLDAYVKKLNNVKLAVRGSKTKKWLKMNDLQANLISEDGTMESLLASFDDAPLNEYGQRVFLQVYNQDDARLKDALERRGFSVYLSKPYSYEEPGVETLNRLHQAIMAQSVDAVIFTSKTQVKNLFTDKYIKRKLTESFNDQVLAVAVGKVTATELETQNIHYVLQPESQKMGAMVVEMDRYYQTVIQ